MHAPPLGLPLLSELAFTNHEDAGTIAEPRQFSKIRFPLFDLVSYRHSRDNLL
ncbi:MAG: hypothetical protein II007_03710 [Gammaproteobacteria bacterium]|nr:hypothetical protein [Gammaproteobacteria bacterium]